MRKTTHVTRRLWKHWFCICFCVYDRQKREDPQIKPHGCHRLHTGWYGRSGISGVHLWILHIKRVTLHKPHLYHFITMIMVHVRHIVNLHFDMVLYGQWQPSIHKTLSLLEDLFNETINTPNSWQNDCPLLWYWNLASAKLPF